MHKIKNYLLAVLIFIICFGIFFSRSEMWDAYLINKVNDDLLDYGWYLETGKVTGNVFGTTVINDIIITHKSGSKIEASKVSMNIGFISSAIKNTSFDLLNVEGMEILLENKKLFSNNDINNFEIPFNIKTLFIEAGLEAYTENNKIELDMMIGGEFNGFDHPELKCDLFKAVLNKNEKFHCNFNSLYVGFKNNQYFLNNLKGNIAGLPITGSISMETKKSELIKGSINFSEFSLPMDLFSKTPFKTKFSNFSGNFDFESNFKFFNGTLFLENAIGLDMKGDFKLIREDYAWIIKELKLEGENSNLMLSGIFEEKRRLNLYMNLDNLDLSRWINNQNPTNMSGLFIMDAGLNREGALDQIDMTMEILESRLFNQGEFSIHGQLNYKDSILSTIDPVMLLVGDSYLTIDGKSNIHRKNIELLTDMERADIDLINSFLPGDFVSGKATGSLKIYGDMLSPSATAELICDNVKVNDFDLKSIELNSQITGKDSIISGFIDIKAGKGIWRKYSFDSGTVSGIINNKQIKIKNCHFQAGKDFLQLSGIFDGDNKYELERIQLAYKDNYLINSTPINLYIEDSIFHINPFELHINDGMMEGVINGGVNPEGRFKMSNFDAEILTQFFDDERLKISGLIFGEIWIEPNGQSFDLDADLSLKKGSYMKEDFDELIFSSFYKDGMLHIDDLTMTRKGEMGIQGNGIIPIVNNNFKKTNISLRSNFSNLSLKFIHRFIPKFFNIDGTATGNIDLNGTLDLTKFSYNVIIENSIFDINDLGLIESNGKYDGKLLNVDFAKSTNSEGQITASGYLPFDLNINSDRFGDFFKNEEMNFNVNANLNSLPYLSNYIADLDSAVGDIEIELLLHGISDSIQRSGSLKVKNGSIHTLLLSDRVANINGYAIMRNNSMNINYFDALVYNSNISELSQKTKNTILNGSIDFTKFFLPNYDLSIKAKNASYQLLLYDISCESDLDLTIIGRDTVHIDGIIETQNASVYYEFTTEDVGTAIKDNQDFILSYNLNIPIRGLGYFKNSQIDAEVTGEINLSQTGNQEVDFGGQIIVEDGSIFAYKDYFDDLDGMVSFDNKGFNPIINVNAYTMIDDERIDLNMRGGIDDLDIILESESGFSESDILELLTWGKRFEDSADMSSTGFGNQTVSILGTFFENELEKNLKESNVGMMTLVDDIDISGAAGLIQEPNQDFIVTTKTQISDKTFLNLSYKRSFSLNQEQSQVGVEYKLNRHFSVVGNVDDDGNLNLKYRYRYAY